MTDDRCLVALLLFHIEVVDIEFEIQLLTHHQDDELVLDTGRQREDYLVEQGVLGCRNRFTVLVVGGAIGSQRLERSEVVVRIYQTDFQLGKRECLGAVDDSLISGCHLSGTHIEAYLQRIGTHDFGQCHESRCRSIIVMIEAQRLTTRTRISSPIDLSGPIAAYFTIRSQSRMNIIFAGRTCRLANRYAFLLAICFLETIIHTCANLEECAEGNGIFAPVAQIAGTAIGLHIEVVVGTRLQPLQIAEGVGSRHQDSVLEILADCPHIPCVVGGEIGRNLHLNHLGTDTIHRNGRHIASRGLRNLEIVHIDGCCAFVQLGQNDIHILARAVVHRTANLCPVGGTCQRIDRIYILHRLEQAIQIGNIRSVTDDNTIGRGSAGC